MSDTWSILHQLHQNQLPETSCLNAPLRRAARNCLRQRFSGEAAHWSVRKTASPFNRRVTCIEWHPCQPHVVAFGAHSGDVYLWNTEDATKDLKIEGLGYGYGCITDMKFNPSDPSLIFSTSVDGRFCMRDFEGKRTEVYLNSMDIQLWWCTVDVSPQQGVCFVGSNTGDGVILDIEGQVIRRYHRLHRGKIKHAEFCPAQSWMLATASNDHTVCLWDTRMLHAPQDTLSKPVPVAMLQHDGVVNSASFDPIYGCRLLTTAQNNELRVYDAHDYTSPSIVITHPHRHFQHMTNITATWHPLYEDTCAIGRYPSREDRDQTRCVDLVDLQTGNRLAYLYQSSLKGIIQLNKFNAAGDAMASGMGYTCLLWKGPDEKNLNLARAEAVMKMEREEGTCPSKAKGRKRKIDGGSKRGAEPAVKRALKTTSFCPSKKRPRK